MTLCVHSFRLLNSFKSTVITHKCLEWRSYGPRINRQLEFVNEIFPFCQSKSMTFLKTKNC